MANPFLEDLEDALKRRGGRLDSKVIHADKSKDVFGEILNEVYGEEGPNDDHYQAFMSTLINGIHKGYFYIGVEDE